MYRMIVNVRQHRATHKEKIAMECWQKIPKIDRDYLLHCYGIHWLHQILRKGIRIKAVKYL